MVCVASVAGLNQGIRNKISPVQKVVQMIDEMAGKVREELDATTADFEEYAKFCDDQSVEKDYAIKDGKESMEELGATITDTSAGIESAAAKIEDLSTKISDTESELSTATALRKKENEEFVKKEKELLETTRELLAPRLRSARKRTKNSSKKEKELLETTRE